MVVAWFFLKYSKLRNVTAHFCRNIFAMLINDLPCFEILTATPAVSGAASTSVIANAIAYGSTPTALTRTNSKARALPRNGSLSISRGFALARGTNAFADVSVSGEGDIVVGSARSTPNGRPVDVARGVIVAISLPS